MTKVTGTAKRMNRFYPDRIPAANRFKYEIWHDTLIVVKILVEEESDSLNKRGFDACRDLCHISSQGTWLALNHKGSLRIKNVLKEIPPCLWLNMPFARCC
jgi:hypothetical protein